MEVSKDEMYTHVYTCQVRLRRGDEWQVKPESEKIDGILSTFRQGWVMDENDTSIYVGETAMFPIAGSSIKGWIALGDLHLIMKFPIDHEKFESLTRIGPLERPFDYEEILAEL